MADNMGHSVAKKKRPERIRNKTCDDNVLGISWREERELRKAMYVSLRQRQPKSPASKGRTKGGTHKNFRIGWLHRRSDSGEKGKTALGRRKNCSTSSSDKGRLSTPVKRSSPTSVPAPKDRPSKSPRSTRSELDKRSTPGPSKPGHRNAKPIRSSRSAFVRAFDAIISSRLRSTNYRNTVRSCVSNASSPQGISAVKSRSNGNLTQPDCETATGTKSKKQPIRDDVQRNNQPVSKHTPSSGSNESDRVVAKRQKRLFQNQSVQGTLSDKSPKKTPQVNGNSSSKGPGRQRSSPSKVTSTPSEESLSNSHLPKNLPPELWQDPHGQPVSVHDFVEYICYHGSPCLDSKLRWFGVRRNPGPLVCPDQQKASLTPPAKTTPTAAATLPSFAGPRGQTLGHHDRAPGGNNASHGTVANCNQSTANALTKSALGCVAKKVAVANPPATPCSPKLKSIQSPDVGPDRLTGHVGSSKVARNGVDKKKSRFGHLTRKIRMLSKLS